MVPPVKGGKVIGKPYEGTHAKKFNQQGGSDNWESENAIDIAVPVGTPVYAVEDGVIGEQFGSQGKGGRFAGLRLHLDGKSHFYYAHLSQIAHGVKPGAHVHAGQLIGYTGSANGVAHLHFAQDGGNPMRYVTGLPEEAERPSATTTQPVSPTQTETQPVDPSGGTGPMLAQTISQVDQLPGADLVNPATVGGAPPTDFNAPAQTSTWQLIASQGNVSPDTIRLAQLAGLASGGNSSQG